MYHWKASYNSLNPKALSQPGTHLTVPQPITCFPKEALPQMTSALSLSSNSHSSPSSTTSSIPSFGASTLSTSDNEADSLCSVHSTSQSTRQLCPRLPITYNETALMKLHSKPQVWMFNSVSLAIPLNDSNQESLTTSDSKEREEESHANL